MTMSGLNPTIIAELAQQGEAGILLASKVLIYPTLRAISYSQVPPALDS